jgi:pyruvate/2-oxoglutarate dehydrogenase complex dihydrolipoamide dehydrogenase (E3) component
MKHSFNAIVVDAGQAGLSLATRLAKESRKVAIVERKLFGGACPTKAMAASAHAAHLARPGQQLRRSGRADAG